LSFSCHPSAQREDLLCALSLFPQKNFKKGGNSWSPKTTTNPTTFSPAIHHKITTKNHTKTPTFSKTPLKNARKTARPRVSPGPNFFLQKTSF
jgi:hypothetical protein